MAFTVGTRLGLYDIIAILGAGGMGEVYRARDTKLGREVAVKVLLEAVASDADRVARFEREAKALAALNHSHIAALYGMEQANPSTGSGQAIHFLVMELVEGETLAERLQRGPMAVTDALKVAHQIAEALEAAHEKGIVHRDLKPANVKITPEDMVKVLDFGLAKVGAGEAGEAGEAAALTHSPTLSVMATQAGVLLGTAAYMSPEQAKGMRADHRSDVFSFGSVLYEMLTGRRPFQGDTAADILASVVARDADLSALPANINPRLIDLLKRCLDKNPKRRWQAVGDLRVEIETIAGVPYASPTTAITRPPPLWSRIAVPIGTLFVGAAVAGTLVWLATRPASARVTRTTIASTGATGLTVTGQDRDLAITADGTRVVYVGNNATQLFVRALDALEPVAIATGVNLRCPFISPDGQWVGFVENTITLKKVAITGGPPVTLAPLDGFGPRGAVWGADDHIYVATNSLTTGLQRVPAGGGTPEVLTRPDQTRGEADHAWPEMLPGAREVLYTIVAQSGGPEGSQVAILDLRTGTQKIILRGASHAQYVGSGYLVYVAAQELRAVHFDLGRLEVRGTAVPVVSRLVTQTSGVSEAIVATDGTLAYVAGSGTAGAASLRTLTWVDRTGKEDPLAAPPRPYVYPQLSPDGTRVAVQSGPDIWTWDLQRATLTRLTSESGTDAVPVWTPDSRRIVFASERGGGALNLWWQVADGTSPAERLTTSSHIQLPSGTYGTDVVFGEVVSTTSIDIMMLPLAGQRSPTPLVQTKFNNRNGVVSPDGRWLAYESDSSGRLEIYVRPFRDAAKGQWQISPAGGRQPLWARNGKELFYVAFDGTLISVPVNATGTTWNPGAPTTLMAVGAYAFGNGGSFPQRLYDVALDGRRFLMMKAVRNDPDASPPAIIIVQHFDEELKRLVPNR